MIEDLIKEADAWLDNPNKLNIPREEQLIKKLSEALKRQHGVLDDERLIGNINTAIIKEIQDYPTKFQTAMLGSSVEPFSRVALKVIKESLAK